MTACCRMSEYCGLPRGKVIWGLAELIGTLLGPERTRILCLSVIGLLPRMNHLMMFRSAFAVAWKDLIVL